LHFFSKFTFIIAFSCLATSCNFYEFFDPPSGNAQLLSAARACFDQGDMRCALRNYQKMSDRHQDLSATESAFVLLDQEGISFSLFYQTFGKGGGAEGFNRMANRLAPSAGLEKRLALLDAYESVLMIEQKDLRGLVRFLTSVALLSEILAEAAGENQRLEKTDFVDQPAECLKAIAKDACSIAPDTSSQIQIDILDLCRKQPEDQKTITSGKTINLFEDLRDKKIEFETEKPHYGMVWGLAHSIRHALQNELEISSGNLERGFSSLIDEILDYETDIAANYSCFSHLMITKGIGE
jgi:hypothetical protein